MDETTTITSETAEEYVSRFGEELLTSPTPECVLCFVHRMLDLFGCDTTLRFAPAWRDRRLPKVRGLERRLQARGGFCDCEIFMNGWELVEEHCVEASDSDELVWPAELPPCAGVGPRSSQPCALWERRRRGW